MTVQKVKIFWLDLDNVSTIEDDINKFIEHKVVVSIKATPNYIIVYYKEH